MAANRTILKIDAFHIAHFEAYENILFHQFDPMNTPKCYTWLESYGSPLSGGKNFFHPVKRQIIGEIIGDAPGQTFYMIFFFQHLF